MVSRHSIDAFTRHAVLLAVLASSAVFLGNGACMDSDAEQTWRVAAHEMPCTGDGPQTCLLVSQDGSERYERLYVGIEGLTWQWGVEYTIDVRVETIEHPTADGSTQRYILERVVDETPIPAGTSFEITATKEHIEGDAASGYRLIDSRGLDCERESLCAAMEAHLTGGTPLRLTLEHTEAPDAPLPILAVESSDDG